MSADRHHPRKRFGQHFLHDPGTLHRIISAIRPLPAERLVEIGPGLGALTRPLLETGGRLDAIELDRYLIPGLRQCCADLGNLTVHNEDALHFNFARLRTGDERLRVVGNLPYNISTPLLFRLIHQLEHIQDMHFMLQREVVERMGAGPGSGAYGRLSVMIQYRCRVKPLFIIPPGAFTPPPRVQSAFVRLTPYRRPPFLVTNEQSFNELVRRAFSQRRKTLRNSLRGLLTHEQMVGAGVDPGARPEVLSPERFAILSNLIGS